MSRKVKCASALSLVVTLGVTLLGADISSANAEESVFAPAGSAVSAPESAEGVDSYTKFISQPVVQPLPAEDSAVEADLFEKEFVGYASG